MNAEFYTLPINEQKRILNRLNTLRGQLNRGYGSLSTPEDLTGTNKVLVLISVHEVINLKSDGYG